MKHSARALLVTLLLALCCGTLAAAPGSPLGGQDTIAPGSCTIFTAAHGDKVFYGGNEDWMLPTTFYWVAPPGEGTYGGLYLGHQSEERTRSHGLASISAQAGVNEKGLAFDYAALPEAGLTPKPELPSARGIMMKIQRHCATVEEAITLARQHDWGSGLRWQVLLADASGDAVVIGAGPDGELAFTRKVKGDGYLATTNFNRANSVNTFPGGHPCPRYDAAVERLARIEDESELTVDLFQRILDATHIEGAVGNTEYSFVFDLPGGLVHINHWHQFGETATLNVGDEIAKRAAVLARSGGDSQAISPRPIKALFSPETVRQAEQEYLAYNNETPTANTVTVVYNHVAADSAAGLERRGGFAVFVRFNGRTVLFDTGGETDALLHNLAKLELDLDGLDAVVISHNHWDHVYGLPGVAAVTGNDPPVYVAASAFEGLRQQNPGANLVAVKKPIKIAPDIWVVGPLDVRYRGVPFSEQALVLDQGDSLVVLVGCSHPGIVHIVEAVKRHVGDKKIDLVAGGYHLRSTSATEVEAIASALHRLGVARLAPSHCSGDEAVEIFRRHWPDGVLPFNLGDTIGF